MRCRPATRATPMLNSSSIRLRRRESVSLGRFQNCNLLEMDHFRRHGVEDELDGKDPGITIRKPHLLHQRGCLALQKTAFLQGSRDLSVVQAAAGFPLEGLGKHQEFRYPLANLSPVARAVCDSLVFVR